MTFQKEGELLLHTINSWASENREGIVSLFWKSHGLCTRKRAFVDEVMGRGRRGVCLGQSCENSDLWNSLFSKRKIPTLEQSMKERDLVSPKWPVSPQAASSLVDESSGWKISGKFSSSEFSCNNFHTLCGKFKIMRVFKQLLEDTESDQIQGEAMGNLTLHLGPRGCHMYVVCPWEYVWDALKQKFTGTWA